MRIYTSTPQHDIPVQVPVGGEEAAIEIASVGEQRTFDFDIR